MTLGRIASILMVATLATGLAGCYRMSGSAGGGRAGATGAVPLSLNPHDVALPPGYRIEVVAAGLNFPTGIAFDDEGRPCISEAGYAYGEVWTTPRLVRVNRDGTTTVLVTGDNPPWTGVDFRDGSFFIAEGGAADGGRIARLAPDGTLSYLVEDIPSVGDHHTNAPRVSPDGRFVYFGVGSATNSGVVGADNFAFGWPTRHPAFRDIPARDIKLTGDNFTTDNPLTPSPDDTVATGAFMPFGTPATPGQVVRGQLPCNGAVLRVPVEGGRCELVAWGLRNPFGLAFAPDGRVFVTENSFDVRGSRPVWGTGDPLWAIDPDNPGLWHGWPDFFAGERLDNGDRFTAPGEPQPTMVLAEHPNTPPAPVAKLPVHSSADGLDVAPDAFGFPGQVFVALFGDMAPAVGKVIAPVGYKVVRVDPRTGVVEDFALNRGGKSDGPASLLGTGGLERPIAVRFGPDGRSLYVVDFGVLAMHGSKPKPRQGTGVLWRIMRTDGEGDP
ncbi:MAG: PQQ-dependent sugar dehydrogenase [Tepidisphaeraceae bacterium]